jgi:SAM-dependent methyltransferase
MSFSSLRREVYRFSARAMQVARWSATRAPVRVLIPSVGLCVHPWLFAAASLSVVATDISRTALATLTNPCALPRVYGAKAQERWDIHESAAYGGQHPEGFEPMPDLENERTCAALRPRIEFIEADWADLPLEDASIDVVFATNALPRGDDETRASVLAEWARVARTGGLIFTQMHNDAGPMAGAFFEQLGWQRIDTLTDERRPGVTAFLEYLSSG